MINKNRSIYDQIKNSDFFKPLTSVYARLYYDVAIQLIEVSLSNPLILFKTAKARTEMCIQRYSERDDCPRDKASLPSASEVLGRMAECGWTTPQRLTSDNRYVITVTKDCSRIISDFQEYSEAGDTEIVNYLYTIVDILKDVVNKNAKNKSRRRSSPYQLIYKDLVRNRRDLERELCELYNNIDDIIKSVTNAKSPKEYYDSFFDGSLKEKFFKPYIRLKDRGHLAYLLGEIQEGMELLKSDAELLEKTVAEFAVINNCEEWEAEREIIRNYTDIELYLSTSKESNFSTQIRAIDDKINSYIGNLASRFAYIFNSQGALKESVDKYLGYVEIHGLENAPDISNAIKINDVKVVSDESVRPPKERQDIMPTTAIEKISLDDMEKARRTAALNDAMKNKYSVRVVASFFDELLGNDDTIVLDNSYITDKKLALIFASGMTFSGAKDFGFRIKPLDYFIESDEIKMKNIQIERI